MGIIGVGVDIERIDRIREVFSGKTEKSLRKIFTENEIEEFNEKVDPVTHMAGKFAAKEAVYKSLSLDRKDGYSMKDIEIIGAPGIPPVCKLHGVLEDLINKKRGSKIFLSISHTDENAVAVAIYLD